MARAMQIDTVGILFFRPDGRITDCNDAFLRMSGVAREDVVAGRVRWDALTPPEWIPVSRRAVARSSRSAAAPRRTRRNTCGRTARAGGACSRRRASVPTKASSTSSTSPSASGPRRRVAAPRPSSARCSNCRASASSRATSGAGGSCVPTAASARCSATREEELRRKSLPDVTHPDDHANWHGDARRLLVGQRARGLVREAACCARTARSIWVDMNLTLMRDAAGTPVRTAGDRARHHGAEGHRTGARRIARTAAAHPGERARLRDHLHRPAAAGDELEPGRGAPHRVQPRRKCSAQ